MISKTIVVLTGLIAAAGTAQADGFKSIARDLAGQAKKARISRVVVMPFEAADGGSPRDGWNISEKILTQLVRTGKVQTLERTMLKALMDEHQLGRTGALDAATLRKLGKMLAAEGIVVGSFVGLGREVEINARLINTETGVIIGASQRRADRDWFEQGIYVPQPVFTVEAPTILTEGEIALRDSVADSDSCEDASSTVDRLEREILDLKARYWAYRLKNGLDLRTLKVNPGSTITDPELKETFYAKMKAWYALERVPALSPVETKRFIALDGQAYSLVQKCGI
jgi:TolB-like protein